MMGIREIKHTAPWQGSNHFMVFSELSVTDRGYHLVRRFFVPEAATFLTMERRISSGRLSIFAKCRFPKIGRWLKENG